MNTGFELRLILGDLKQHCDLPLKAVVYGGQVTNGVSAKV
jgi:hypothetical protein